MDRLTLSKKHALSYLYHENGFIYVKRNRDTQIMPHGHDFLEITYITHGGGTHKIGDESFSVVPGDVFIVPKGVFHSFTPDNFNDPIEHYDCLILLEEASNQIDYSVFSDIASDLFYNKLFPQDVNRSPYIYLKDNHGSLLHVLSIMDNETHSPKEDSANLLFGCAIELLVLLGRLYQEQFGKKEVIQKRRDSILTAIQYLEKNYNRKISLNELSRIALFSPNYFCTLFKETTGMGVTEYIQQIRNKEAIRLLISTDLTVMEICQRIGYSDERLFRRVFSKSIGCSPSEYRKRYKN